MQAAQKSNRMMAIGRRIVFRGDFMLFTSLSLVVKMEVCRLSGIISDFSGTGNAGEQKKSKKTYCFFAAKCYDVTNKWYYTPAWCATLMLRMELL